MPFCGWLLLLDLGRSPPCSNGNVVRTYRVDSPHTLRPKHDPIACTTPNWIDIVWRVRCNCRLWMREEKKRINIVFDLKCNREKCALRKLKLKCFFVVPAKACVGNAIHYDVQQAIDCPFDKFRRKCCSVWEIRVAESVNNIYDYFIFVALKAS